jgi:hypothetical protein
MLLSDMISRLERRHMGAYLEMLDIAMLLRCSISHLPNAAPESPRTLDLILTHIFGKGLGRRLDKAEILPVSAIQVGLPGSFTQSVC